MNMLSSPVQITVLMDNITGAGLRCEHGFAVWIEAAARRILFDTGPVDTGRGSALCHNAKRLGVDLHTVDSIVLSHGHSDHTGGLADVSEYAPNAVIYAHPAVTRRRYSIRNGEARRISMPTAARIAMEAHRGGMCRVNGPMTIIEGVGITGPILRCTDYEDTGGPFYIDPDGVDPDPLEDDLALWIRTDRGLIVIVGCCHAGLINTLRCALAQSGEQRLYAVLGGFHLNAAGETRLHRTMTDLQAMDPHRIISCHCTGETAIQYLRHTFGDQVVPGRVGAMLCFEKAIVG